LLFDCDYCVRRHLVLQRLKQRDGHVVGDVLSPHRIGGHASVGNSESFTLWITGGVGQHYQRHKDPIDDRVHLALTVAARCFHVCYAYFERRFRSRSRIGPYYIAAKQRWQRRIDAGCIRSEHVDGAQRRV
jgi:hypothetical protein